MTGTERWLPVVGWEGFYEVSDLGRVKSLPRAVLGRYGNTVYLTLRILKGNTKPNDGHRTVTFSRDATDITVSLHRLVLLTFVGPCPDGMEGCHGDGDPSNNAVTNLRWGTRSDNMRDRVTHGGDPNARKTHCPQMHPYSAENTYNHPNTSGRTCRTCKRRWKARDRTLQRELRNIDRAAS